ncbi:MAG: hypothetical protein WAR57_12470, partial [Candidatus Phosphoribacter sp.]
AAALVLLVAGLRGRRAPFTSAVVLCALITSATLALTPGALIWGAGVGEPRWSPRASAPAADGSQVPASYSLTVGEATLDLAGITPEANFYPVNASLAVGELIILVPQGLTARIDVQVGLGEVTNELPSTRGSAVTVAAGAGSTSTIMTGDGDPDVVVTASVGLGTLIVRNAGGAS